MVGTGRRWTLKALSGLVAVTAAAAAAAGGLAAAKTAPSISIHVSPAVHSYTQTAAIYGRLSTGHAGVSVTLEERQWPFNKPFEAVDAHATGSNGGYSFHHRSSIAAEYRVAETGKALHSATRTVYTEIGYAQRYCHFIRKSTGQDTGCGQSNRPAGTYRYEFSLHYFYPGKVYAQEKTKPVYFYFGQRDGQDSPPSQLTLHKTVVQHAKSGNSTVLNVSIEVQVPATAWDSAIALCTKSSYTTDGFGLPGPPGSHHCGAATITYAESQQWLG